MKTDMCENRIAVATNGSMMVPGRAKILPMVMVSFVGRKFGAKAEQSKNGKNVSPRSSTGLGIGKIEVVVRRRLLLYQ